jgi:sulfotransferase
LAQLFPAAKVICCVRDVGWIMDSIERLVRRNAFQLSGMFGFEPGNTVFTRMNRIAMSDGMVGYALDALKEAFYGDQSDRLILLEYEALARAPESALRHLYGLLGEAWFEHDFANIEYEAESFDLALGTPGLHVVRRRAEWVERETVLPPELFARFVNDAFWRTPDAMRRGVPMIHIER